MKLWRRNLFKSIQGKILFLSLSVVTFAIISIATVFLINSTREYIFFMQRTLINTIQGLAPILIDYESNQSIQNSTWITSVLGNIENIQCYKIFNSEGVDILSNGCNDFVDKFDLNIQREEFQYIDGSLHIINNITDKNRTYGFIYFIISADQIYEYIKYGILNILIILCVTLSTSMFLALKIQKRFVNNFYRAIRTLDEFKNETNIDFSASDEIDLLFQAVRKIKEKLSQTEFQLERSEKLAAQGDLAGGIAHEINNPVSIISINAELLEMEMLSGRINHDNILNKIRLVKKTAMTIGNMIQSLLRLSRNIMHSAMENHNFKNIIDEALLLSSPRLSKKKVRLDILPFNEDLCLECNSIQVAQVLANLINNAYDAIVHLNDPFITLEVDVVGESVLIFVRDSGPGIPLSLQKDLFVKQQTTKKEGAGSGLGLILTHKMIKAHSGEIEYYLDRNVSTFKIMLPINQKTRVSKKLNAA